MKIKDNDFMPSEFIRKDMAVTILLVMVDGWFNQYFRLNYYWSDFICGVLLYLSGVVSLYIYYKKLSKPDNFPKVYELLKWFAIMLLFVFLLDTAPKWLGFHRNTWWVIGILLFYFLFLYISRKFFKAKRRPS